jgi:hypothetical protein
MLLMVSIRTSGRERRWERLLPLLGILDKLAGTLNLKLTSFLLLLVHEVRADDEWHNFFSQLVSLHIILNIVNK